MQSVVWFNSHLAYRIGMLRFKSYLFYSAVWRPILPQSHNVQCLCSLWEMTINNVSCFIKQCRHRLGLEKEKSHHRLWKMKMPALGKHSPLKREESQGQSPVVRQNGQMGPRTAVSKRDCILQSPGEIPKLLTPGSPGPGDSDWIVLACGPESGEF